MCFLIFQTAGGVGKVIQKKKNKNTQTNNNQKAPKALRQYYVSDFHLYNLCGAKTETNKQKNVKTNERQ